MTPTIRYGPDGPTERELRLLGTVVGKRVLDLGCGTGEVAIALAAQGAVTIAVDPSEAVLDRARANADAAEARVEWHASDLADLAFLRADSIDVAVSVDAIAGVDDLARLLRQVQRVLRPSAPFVFSYRHPFAACIGPDQRVVRSYFATPDAGTPRFHPISSIVTELHRAGFRVDLVAEPRPGDETALVPSTIVWRARKEGN